ncbi:signal peptidase II [Paenibacillus humicus]|uniref:signal peptidase II n=1 Tax=Paenibacillus humicus TaxID=412861 RepID=UPI003F5CEF53
MSMLPYYLLSILALGMDQVIKWIVVTNMKLGESIPLLPDIFHLTSHRNRGAAFGILQDQRLFFLVVTIVVLIGLIIYLHRVHQENKFLSYGLALVLGGAAGNFVDRFLRGEVVDLFDFRWINFPIFNLADVFIMLGAAIIIVSNLKESKSGKNLSL